MLRVAFSASLIFLCGPWNAHANLIENGDFETGDFTGWTQHDVSYPESIVQTPVHGGTYAAQIAGFHGDPDTLSQTIATTPGETYTLSFWRLVNNGVPPIGLTVLWDGNQIFSEVNPGAQPYQEFSFQVTGTGSDTLLFSAYNDPSVTYLDDVSLTPAGPVVPEPGAVTLLVTGGIAVLGAYRRRQRPHKESR